MMEYYVCADGGGTKTHALVFDSLGNVLGEAVSGPVNANFMPAAVAFDNLFGGITRCLAAAGIEVRQVSKICIFSPGVRPYQQQLMDALSPVETEVLSDRYNSFWGALAGPPGIVLLSGTGSFTFGIDAQGQEIMAGGWGSVFGDGGSGYHIGVMCLRAVTRRHDSGLPPGVLSHLTLEHTGFADVEELRLGMNSPTVGRKEIAALCPVVARAAGLGDGDALGILDDAARELALQAAQVYGRFGSPDWPWAFVGGVSQMGDLILKPLKWHMRDICPNMVYQPPVYPPCVGGALYMLSPLGGQARWDEIIANINKYSSAQAQG